VVSRPTELPCPFAGSPDVVSLGVVRTMAIKCSALSVQLSDRLGGLSHVFASL
jgi:hypothetical protein